MEKGIKAAQGKNKALFWTWKYGKQKEGIIALRNVGIYTNTCAWRKLQTMEKVFSVMSNLQLSFKINVLEVHQNTYMC